MSEIGDKPIGDDSPEQIGLLTARKCSWKPYFVLSQFNKPIDDNSFSLLYTAPYSGLMLGYGAIF